MAAIGLISGLFAASCEAQTTEKRWILMEIYNEYLIAVDRESIVATGDTVSVHAASVFTDPIDVNGNMMTHLVADLSYLCPLSVVENRYEWRYSSEGMFQEGETGIPPVNVEPNSVYALIGQPACDGVLSENSNESFYHLNDLVDHHRAWIAYRDGQGS